MIHNKSIFLRLMLLYVVAIATWTYVRWIFIKEFWLSDFNLEKVLSLPIGALLMVLPIYASMEKFDFSLVEASYDLYASRFKVLKRIILPLVKPGIVAGSILVFIPSLGAFVTPRILGGGKNMMLGNLIGLQFGQGRNWPLGAALSITLLAIVMVALLVYVRGVGKSDVNHG